MPFLLTIVAVICIASSVVLAKLVSDTENWIPANGVIRENEADHRLIIFKVGKGTYTTSNQTAVDLLAHKVGLETNFRPGASKTKIDGIDPEIGRGITIFYNPKNPAEAVVEKGWSLSVIILLLCSTAPFLLTAFAALNGWETNNNGYDPFNN
ncbi:DUF3592 domain-containing protein [bacterium]|nr:DUF3592 domain-containing protein [bacterium]